MTSFRVWGIFFLAGAAGFGVAAFAVPGAGAGAGVEVAFVSGAVAFALVGALFLWMHTFMKDVPKVGIRSGLERMATGTAFAAQTLQDMTGQAAGAARHGIDPRPGTATVEAVTDTGMLVNHDPVVLIDLRVTIAGNPPYAVRRREVVSKLDTAQLAPGTTLPVSVDAQDPYEVSIRWGSRPHEGRGTMPAG